MSDITAILSAVDRGDPTAAEKLLPLVYDELRKLAARQLAREKPGQTLQATALVHEAYLRIAGGESGSALGQSGPLFRGGRGSHAPHPCGERRGESKVSKGAAASGSKAWRRIPVCRRGASIHWRSWRFTNRSTGWPPSPRERPNWSNCVTSWAARFPRRRTFRDRRGDRRGGLDLCQSLVAAASAARGAEKRGIAVKSLRGFDGPCRIERRGRGCCVRDQRGPSCRSVP